MTARKVLMGGMVAVLVLLGLAVTPSIASATSPLPLLLPQSTAFSYLGHSCGGIQEQSVTSGFDPSSGFPIGDVYMQTRCGGSGRGGGHGTTYSAWASVTWDFTDTVVSSAVLSTGPTNVNLSFTAFDAHGNEVYNTAATIAYLSLAPGFVPVPRITGMSPTTGPAASGTALTIDGTGFTGATAVSFGGTPAASFAVNSDNAISAVTPLTSPGTVDVAVTTAGGPSSASTINQFTFVAAPTVASVTPNSGPVAGGTSVTITGANFSGATQVAFGGNPTGFTVNNDSSITATSPFSDSADTVDVTVTTVGGTNAPSGADQFTYTSSSGCGSACISSVQCAKLTGTLNGAITVAKCAPASKGNKSASSAALTSTFTWTTSGQTTEESLNSPTSPGQGGCARGHVEYDISGTVSGGTSTYTVIGDVISARTCASKTGQLSLVRGTTFSL